MKWALNVSFTSDLDSILADVDFIDIVIEHPVGALLMDTDCGGVASLSYTPPLPITCSRVGLTSFKF